MMAMQMLITYLRTHIPYVVVVSCTKLICSVFWGGWKLVGSLHLQPRGQKGQQHLELSMLFWRRKCAAAGLPCCSLSWSHLFKASLAGVMEAAMYSLVLLYSCSFMSPS